MITKSIIIPIYNESASIKKVVDDISSLNIPHTSILVIDDGSTDNPKEALKDSNCVYWKQEFRGGKGTALWKGANLATSDYVIFFDGDGQDEPKDLLSVINHLPMSPDQIIFGSRFLQNSIRQSGALKPVNHLGNRIVTGIINLIFKSNITDSQTSIKAFPRQTLLSLNLKKNGYLVETEIVVKLAKAQFKITEIPVTRKPRTGGYSKLHQVFGARFQFAVSFLFFIFQQALVNKNDN